MKGTTARIFVARLAGTAVFDPNGDQVGKVLDLLIMLRSGTNPPRVLGLVVEVQPRRRIFVPMTRVTSVDAGQVVTTGLVNLRRFEQRPGETLVIGELLDRHADLIETDEKVTVLDVGIEPDRMRDWVVTDLYVRKGGSGIRRRGQTLVVRWGQVRGLSLNDGQQGADSLLATLELARPTDIAALLQDLPPKRQVEIARALDDERLADVLEELPEDDAVEIVSMLEKERAADVVEEMDPDDAADLLSEMAPERAAELLSLMEPEDAEDLRRLLTYDDYTAGGMMTTEPLIIAPDATVAEALARIRNPDVSPSLAAQVYVVRPPLETPTGRFIGVAHFQRLLREPPATLVSAIVDTELSPVRADSPLEAITRYFAAYNLVALPVVDDADHLLGAVTVDDVIDHMLPEGWRDHDHHIEPAVRDGG
jgi:flagellar motility protein MotE (MotC chaperone)